MAYSRGDQLAGLIAVALIFGLWVAAIVASLFYYL